MKTCPSCDAEILDIDVKCAKCGFQLGASGAQRMIGTVVLGQYELVDVLGQGGMSVVYKGRHRMTDQEVALKILPPELAAHSQVKSRFLEEAKALAALDHPNIVHLYNFGQENGCFVLAMQFVSGDTWERMILEKKRLDWIQSCKIAVDVLRALEYAHGRGVVHRDMKPSNVLVRDHDHMATVMDFGIAKMTTSTKLTATGQTMGTVRYMSPEQVRGQEVDFRTDIYSLGATLYESLTGDTPFDGQTHFEIMTKHLQEPPKRPTTLGIQVPLSVEDALVRSLAKRAEDRFDSARDMRLILENALRSGDVGLLETQRVSREDIEIPARLPTATPVAAELSLPRPARSFPWVALVVFLVLAGGGGAAAYMLTRPGDAPPKPRELKPLAMTAGMRVDKAALEAAYNHAVKRVDDYFTAHLPHVKVDHPLERLLVVPDLCDAALYAGKYKQKTQNCAKVGSNIAGADPRTLLVVDDPKKLAEAMDSGITLAVDEFDAFSVDGDTSPDARANMHRQVDESLNGLLVEIIQGDSAPTH